jgi:hypothetical protein
LVVLMLEPLLLLLVLLLLLLLQLLALALLLRLVLLLLDPQLLFLALLLHLLLLAASAVAELDEKRMREGVSGCLWPEQVADPALDHKPAKEGESSDR